MNTSSILPGARSHDKKQQWTEKTQGLKWTNSTTLHTLDVLYPPSATWLAWDEARLYQHHAATCLYMCFRLMWASKYTDDVTSSHCSTQSFGCRQTPAFTSWLKTGSNPQWRGHLQYYQEGWGEGWERDPWKRRKSQSCLFRWATSQYHTKMNKWILEKCIRSEQILFIFYMCNLDFYTKRDLLENKQNHTIFLYDQIGLINLFKQYH